LILHPDEINDFGELQVVNVKNLKTEYKRTTIDIKEQYAKPPLYYRNP
jgi:hypothetical protein